MADGEQKAAIILAAGEGKRMKSALPKVLHMVAGRPILGHVMAAVRAAGVSRIVVVTAPQAESVREFARAQGAQPVVQDRQLGTGHAAAAAAPALEDFSGEAIVTYGDMPLVRPEIFAASFAARARRGMAIVAFRSKNPAYGRVIADNDGLLDRIVEYRDANEAERMVDLCNAGIMAADAQSLFRWARRLKNDNAQHEYYLTDVPLMAKADGVRCAIVTAREEEMQKRLRAQALDNAVGMTAPETVFLCSDTVLEPDCFIEPYVVFGPGVTVRSGARIRAFSHLEGCDVGKGAIVGPYARIRPGSVLEDDVHIGNFVEVKKTRVEKGAKANHLAYLGDARVGARANIGAGTITCNYDGFDKYETGIGAGAFIGSNTALVAPVKIGDGAIVGAGSVITGDVTKDALAVERNEQREIENWAARFRARKQAEKRKK